ncbi:WD40 repeat-like protein [Myriangium duriaei CBS 260.36]|uniref:WD40 repeat-like protein n=1 Tax=Myriangium duriaei CBS 260.36 TaxID=1168546 RepID=A0A9P4IZQ7_9PEZI|nr:WD40 repeat-like protein [Myriangium duriaei CBS 260.36]
MDIHRSRFVEYPASPINSVSFSRSSDKNLNDPKPALKLAIGRADGSIEIWNPDRGHWVQETVFTGGEGRSIEGLVWTQDPNDADVDGRPIVGQLRLFSIGSTSSVTEWNLGTGKALRASTGNFSEVWCLAAQPQWKAVKSSEIASNEPEWKGQDLVAGCGDGTLAILTTADDDLTFKRFLARAGSHKTRCMSVVWQNRERVVAGFSDSHIRVYDARNGSLLRTMSLGVGVPGAPKDTLVWRVKCLPTSDIVSADSNGEIRFWDGKSYSMTQRLSGHDSDCLDLVTSSDGQTVLSGGIDGKVATYRLTSGAGEKRRWAKLSHRRIHQGDVKSMAVYDSKHMSVVVSGGSDTEPAVLPLREMNRENHRRLPGLPHQQPCASAPQARLVASWWERTVCVWRIGKQEGVRLNPDARGKQLVLKLCVKGEDDVSDAAFSKDGRLLALRPSKRQDKRLRATPVDLPSDVIKEGSKCVSISPDGKWLSTVNLANDVKVMRITTNRTDPKHLEVVGEAAELERIYRKPVQQTGLKSYDNTVSKLVFSTDSSVLCTADISGHIDTFILKGEDDPSAPPSIRVRPTRSPKKPSARRPTSDSDSDSDSSEDEDDYPLSFFSQTWTESPISSKLPHLDSPVLVMTFHPSAPLQHHLLVVTQHHQIYELDLHTGKLSDWSRRNPTSVLPPELRSIKDRITGAIWDPAPGSDGERSDRVWLHGTTWLAMLDISQDFASTTSTNAIEAAGAGEKRKRITEDEKWALRAAGAAKRRGTSGAGDRVPEHEAGGVATAATWEGEELTLTVLPKRDEDGEEDEGDEMDVDDEAGPLRREEEGALVVAGQKGRRRWWCTYKYRPILGVVPLVLAQCEVVGVTQPLLFLE